MMQTTGRNIRLVNGTVPNEGRVEVRNGLNDEWGTVCDDFFEEVEAQVACHQLGYTTSGATALMGAHFGQGSGPIHLDTPNCRGSEATLFECPGDESVPNCAHHEDAGIFCSPGKLIIIQQDVTKPADLIFASLTLCYLKLDIMCATGNQ